MQAGTSDIRPEKDLDAFLEDMPPLSCFFGLVFGGCRKHDQNDSSDNNKTNVFDHMIILLNPVYVFV